MDDRLGRAFVVLVGITLVAWCIARYEPHTYLHTDGRAYATMNRAIAEHGDLDIGRYERNAAAFRALEHGISNIALGRDGRLRPKHSYLLPVASTPLYVAFGLPGLLVFDLLANLAMLALVYRFAARFTGPVPAALATLALATSPIVMEQVYGYSHDSLCALLVAGSLVALAERRWAIAGIVAGLALWAKVTVVGVLAPMSIAIVVWNARATSGSRRRDALRYGAGLVAVSIAHAAANTYLFGAPWETSYGRVLSMQRGELALDPIGRYFGQPIVETTIELVTGPNGFVQQMPLAIVAAFGLLVLLPKARTVSIGAFGAVAGFIAIFCTYKWPHARYAIAWLPVFTLGLAAIVGKLARLPFDGSLPEASDVRRENRWILLVIGVVGLIGVCTALAIVSIDPPARLSGRLGGAVARVGDLTCDFLELSAERLTCFRSRARRLHLVGRPLRGECGAHDELGPMLFATPEFRGSTTRVTWRALPRGVAPRVVIATGARPPRAGPSVLELRANGRPVRTFQLDGSDVRRRERLPADLMARDATTLEIEVRGAPSPVCFDVRWD